VQLRAALRASAHAELRILFPMVTSIEEVRAARRIFSEVREQLVEQGHDVAPDVPVGLMIEVPSTVLTLPQFLQECDFVSVGTNDLVQYLLAVDRDNPWVAKLYDPQHPAVWKALAIVAEGARAARKPSSVCGEMAGDYATALLLMGLGFDSVSVVPHLLSELRFAVREIAHSEARSLAAQALREDTSAGIGKVLAQVRELLHRRHISEDSDDGAFEASPPADGSGAREPA